MHIDVIETDCSPLYYVASTWYKGGYFEAEGSTAENSMLALLSSISLGQMLEDALYV